MSDFSVEQKLELVQQIRSQYYRNQSDLLNREQILYGRATARKPEVEFHQPQLSSETTQEPLITDNTVKLRYALAAVLMLLIILFDRSDTSIAGVSMEQVFSVIANDYEEAIDAWVDTLEITDVENTDIISSTNSS